MEDPWRSLKRCMEQTCSAVHVRFGGFATAVGLNDFLLDTFDVPRTPKEIAVRALDQLCEGDKRQNDRVVCLAVISFLDETLGRPKEDTDRSLRLKDLAQLVSGSTPPGEFERWVETWYE
jgi:hypothetical protein